MSEDRSVNISLVPKFADKALENMLEKPSKGIGETFADIWYLVFGGPVGNLAEKKKIKYAQDLERFRKLIENKINAIPENNKTEPSVQLVGQLLDASKYCVEDELIREIFANLLSSSMDSDKKKLIHPLYADIIKKMTPNDALLFFIIAKDEKMDFDIVFSIDELAISLETLTILGLLKKKEIEVTPGYIDRNILYDVHQFVEYVNAVLISNDLGEHVINETAVINIGYGFQELFWKDFQLTRLGEIFKQICF